MPKKPSARTLMDREHAKGSEILIKHARQYLFYKFWSLWKKISSKKSFLELHETFRLFVDILTPDYMYSLSVKASV